MGDGCREIISILCKSAAILLEVITWQKINVFLGGDKGSRHVDFSFSPSLKLSCKWSMWASISVLMLHESSCVSQKQVFWSVTRVPITISHIIGLCLSPSRYWCLLCHYTGFRTLFSITVY